MANANIYIREMLIILDYLLNHTDEKHPAKVEAICKYANAQYNLKYSKEEPKGNEIRRDRVKQTLDYIYDLNQKYVDAFPFIIEKTDGNKYYIESKFITNELQIKQIITAIKNDKYTSKKEADELTELILNLTTNKFNKERILGSINQIKSKRLSITLGKKIELLTKAKEEKKIVQIKKSDTNIDKDGNINKIEKMIRYFVYEIKEFNKNPYVILIPLNNSGVECMNIKDIDFNGRKINGDILIDDLSDDRDLDELFRKNAKGGFEQYQTIQDYLKDIIKPGQANLPEKVSLYFECRYLEEVKNSFEEFFVCPMPTMFCNIIYDKSKEKDNDYNDFAIGIDEAIELKDNPIWCVVNISINRNAIIGWLLSSPNVIQYITVLAPKTINEEIKAYYEVMLQKYSNILV